MSLRCFDSLPAEGLSLALIRFALIRKRKGRPRVFKHDVLLLDEIAEIGNLTWSPEIEAKRFSRFSVAVFPYGNAQINVIFVARRGVTGMTL